VYSRPEQISLSGNGTVVGIIDQPSWLDNPAYSDNIIKRFAISQTAFANEFDEYAPMHGAAVSSIVVGKIGIAPRAKVVYCGIETWRGRTSLLQNHAKGLLRLRAYVEAGNRLDAITTSHGWLKHEQNAAENDSLVTWFNAHNIPVFSNNDALIYPCGPAGLADAWKDAPRPPVIREGMIAVPLDHRLIACRNRKEINASGDLFYRISQGGASWGPPFLAGFFLLAREFRQDISRPEFGRILLATKRSIKFSSSTTLPLPDIRAFCELILSNGPYHRPKNLLLPRKLQNVP